MQLLVLCRQELEFFLDAILVVESLLLVRREIPISHDFLRGILLLAWRFAL